MQSIGMQMWTSNARSKLEPITAFTITCFNFINDIELRSAVIVIDVKLKKTYPAFRHIPLLSI